MKGGRAKHERAIRGLLSRPVGCWREKDVRRVINTMADAQREDFEAIQTAARKAAALRREQGREESGDAFILADSTLDRIDSIFMAVHRRA